MKSNCLNNENILHPLWMGVISFFNLGAWAGLYAYILSFVMSYAGKDFNESIF